jgi:hypothetical protein
MTLTRLERQVRAVISANGTQDDRLATATDIKPGPPDVRDRFLARVRLPEEFVEGPTPGQLERLAALRSQAAKLRDVFVVCVSDGSLIVAVTSEGRIVVPPED